MRWITPWSILIPWEPSLSITALLIQIAVKKRIAPIGINYYIGILS